MDFERIMKNKARSMHKTLVLPEGTDPRTVRAARTILDDKLAGKVILLGKVSDIQKTAEKEGVDLNGIEIISPSAHANVNKYANEYYELRKQKGMTEEQAKSDIADPLRWGSMKIGRAHV